MPCLIFDRKQHFLECKHNQKQFRQQLMRDGYLYLPSFLSEGADWLRLVRLLIPGKLLPQEQGERIYDVRPEIANKQTSDSNSSNPLRPHTDGNYCQVTPQWLVLYCLQDAACGGGFTQLVDGWELLRNFSYDEQQMLMRRHCIFTNKTQTQKCIAPMLQPGKGGSLMWRYSHNTVLFGEPSPKMDAVPIEQDLWLQDIVERITTLCQSWHVAIRMQPGSLLLLDNRRMLHYRTGFTDYNRHLQRLWFSD